MGEADRRTLPRELAFVDLETTGGNAACHRITEIGIVRIVDDALVEQWSTLVNPECPIPAPIAAITGISNAMVADAPRFAEVAATVAAKLEGALFVAHNARFDHSFLRSEYRRIERDFAGIALCTVKLSRRLFPDQARHNLDAVMQRHGLECGARHRALGDARVLADLWMKLRRELPQDRLAAAVEAVLAAGARSTEAGSANTLQALYERRRRGRAGAFTWTVADDRPDRLELTGVEDLDCAALARCFGLFRSRREAAKALREIARAQQLCLKALGLEDGAGSCVAYQLGRCRGACVGRESAPMHGARLQIALATMRLKSWPFPGPIALRDRGAAGRVERLVLDQWALLGTARSDEELAEIAASPCRAAFDPDVYRILVRHFAQAGQLDWVDLRPKTARA